MGLILLKLMLTLLDRVLGVEEGLRILSDKKLFIGYKGSRFFL